MSAPGATVRSGLEVAATGPTVRRSRGTPRQRPRGLTCNQHVGLLTDASGDATPQRFDEILHLAARAVGLGAALITLPLWNTFAARRALGLPWTVTPCAVIPVGWPTGRYGPTTRLPIEDVVSIDRYGNRPWRDS